MGQLTLRRDRRVVYNYEVNIMLRLAIVAAVVVMNSPALAQPIDEVKDLKFGAGCIGPVSTFAARVGTCLIEGSKSRVWCPNGKIFDRSWPVSAVIARRQGDV